MIEVTNLVKAYGLNLVLDHFSCQIGEGSITCLMGPSGCGKTTLLRILMGLEAADGGQIIGLQGKAISAVFQENRLAENFSAYQNVRMAAPAEMPKEDLLHALEAVGLRQAAYQPVRELSGGMRRRVAILRALHATYDILYLDEPFKGLDADTKESVMAYVKDSIKGKTVLFVTHDETEVEIMDGTKVLMGIKG